VVLHNRLYIENAVATQALVEVPSWESLVGCVLLCPRVLCPHVCCVLPEQSDVRAPKTTRHIQAICWSKVKAQDEVETVQLMIQTSLPNSEGNSRSRSDSSKSVHANLIADIGKAYTGRTAKSRCHYSVPTTEHILQHQLSLWSL